MLIAAAARSKGCAPKDRRTQCALAADPCEDEVVRRSALDMRGELFDEKAREWDLASLMPLGCAPHLLRADQRDGLRDHDASPEKVDAPDA